MPLKTHYKNCTCIQAFPHAAMVHSVNPSAQPAVIGILARAEEVCTGVSDCEHIWHGRQLLLGQPYLGMQGLESQRSKHYYTLGTVVESRTCAQVTNHAGFTGRASLQASASSNGACWEDKKSANMERSGFPCDIQSQQMYLRWNHQPTGKWTHIPLL